MNRMLIVGALAGAIGVVLAGTAFVRAGSPVVGAASTKSAPVRIEDPFQTLVGTPLHIPEVIPLKWANKWAYSPDGTRLAFVEPFSSWIWHLGTSRVDRLTPTADDELHGATFSPSGLFWTDDRHVLVLEGQSNLAEARSRPPGTLANMGLRWVLFDSVTGERVRVVETRESPDGVHVVGVRDMDVWYVLAPDRKLRTYDSRTGEFGTEAYFDYNTGDAMQVAPGSPWFSAAIPTDPDSAKRHRGRVEVFNIETGETRSVDDVYLSPPPGMVTPDARYLLTVVAHQDGGGMLVLHDLLLGVQRPLPAGERWFVAAMSGARGTVLVIVLTPGNQPDDIVCTYSEVPLSYITQW